jgi:hypothetical protein
VHRAHRFDGNCRFHDAVFANHSKMDLSIRGHRLFKDGSPINFPTGKDSAGITCDREKESLPVHMRQANAIMDIRSIISEMHHGILADCKTVTGPRFSRVVFCFSFRHSWKTVAQIS